MAGIGGIHNSVKGYDEPVDEHRYCRGTLLYIPGWVVHQRVNSLYIQHNIYPPYVRESIVELPNQAVPYPGFTAQSEGPGGPLLGFLDPPGSMRH